MKKEILKKYIRSIVREELQRAFKSELREHLVEILSGGIKSQSQIVPEDVYSSQVPSRQKSNPQPNKKFVKYTNNNVLNQVLNETKGGVPQEGSYVGYSEPLSYGNSDNSGNVIQDNESSLSIRDAYSQIYNQETPEYSHTQQQTPRQHADPNVQGVLNVLNRDFSAVLKKVDEKVKNKV